MGALDNRNAFSVIPDAENLSLRCWLVLSTGQVKACVLYCSYSFWWLLTIFGFPWIIMNYPSLGPCFRFVNCKIHLHVSKSFPLVSSSAGLWLKCEWLQSTLIFEYLVPSWWTCSGRIMRSSLVGGSMSLRRVVGHGVLSQNSRKATKTSYIEIRCTQCSQVQISV